MSRPQVTITLGRSGQVVKRPESSSSEYLPSSGSKRSVKDRLGNIADFDSNQHPSKRQRRDGYKGNSLDDINGARVNQNDLRYKLMRKKLSRKTLSDDEDNRNNMDLREKLSRAAQSSLRTESRQRMPEPKATSSRQRMPEPRATDARQRMPEPKTTGLLRRSPPTRSVDDLVHMDSMRKSYSGWTSDGIRRRSPDRLLGTSRGLSPPRPVDVRRPVGQMSSVTHVDASRSTSYIGKDVFDPSRHTSFMPKASVPLESGNPVVRFPPPSAAGVTQKISYMGEEVTVSSLLHSLGLGKYAILFQAEEVDMTALKQMGDHDLKELGIPMGPRKKILLSVAGRSKRHP